ncbi:MAG: proton-conducting transporter membrane subunit [Dehalococcoidia bacterium]|nr:proton-conducting transporter membrane subunit [Dehalococcoidia bacterium]
MILLMYALPGLVLLAILFMRPQRPGFGRLLNIATVVNASIYLASTIFILAWVQLPVSFFSGNYLYIDMFGLYEVLIASIVFLLAALYARGYIRGLLKKKEIDRENLKLFYGAFNLLLIVIVFAFISNNLALFWILLELTTILSAILIVTLNARENVLAALKYVFTASTAMLFSFIGIILIFAMTQQALGTGTLNWSELIVQAHSLPTPLFTLAFMFIFIGLAAKAGIVPFHTWLPPAHAKAPSVVSALLSAVLLNTGIYGIIRLYAIAHRTPAIKQISLMLIIFGVVTVGIAAFSMLSRENIKKLVAFSSIEHMGLMIIGLGLGTPVVLFWVLFHTLGHALIKSLLFFSAGILHQEFGSNKFYDMKNVLSLQPLASLGLIVGGVAIIGTPMFPLFFSKLYILIQLGEFSKPLLFLVLLLLLIVAASIAIFLIRTCCQTDEVKPAVRYRVPWVMKAPIITLMVMIFTIGIFFPKMLQNMLSGIVFSLGF